MKGSWWKYGLTIFATVAVCFVLALVYSNAHSAKLNADLDKARSDNAILRTSLDKSLRDVTELTGDLRFIHGQLDIENHIADGQRTTIERQQQLIDAAKRALAGIAQSVSGAVGDVRKQILAFSDGFKRLYIIYHPGGK